MDLHKEWYILEFDNSETSPIHRPLEEEYSFYQAVKMGDLNYIHENCDRKCFSNPQGMGILSMDALTNIKYHFVITVAMITRYCVEGGMTLEESYRLSDFYILKLDSCHSIEEVTALHKHMTFDFTRRMSLIRKKFSKSISLCMDYIYTHIHDRITINEIAEYTNLSTSHLSKLFKKEVGISVSDYIREKKIETAKNLLQYSDLSLIEISNHLAFSSQSHFIQTFEKYTGFTPKRYRDKCFRIAHETAEEVAISDTKKGLA
ncbi:MAG: AraC family transcriptional regulator [Cellulosilyticum sp.]|nr:AraC family transcriptional regulator [Cellulosilyticum sp.]